MDTIDRIIKNLAGDNIEITREQVLKRCERLGNTPEEWLAELEESDKLLSDPEIGGAPADPTGVVNMDKFSQVPSYEIIKDDKDKA